MQLFFIVPIPHCLQFFDGDCCRKLQIHATHAFIGHDEKNWTDACERNEWYRYFGFIVMRSPFRWQSFRLPMILFNSLPTVQHNQFDSCWIDPRPFYISKEKRREKKIIHGDIKTIILISKYVVKGEKKSRSNHILTIDLNWLDFLFRFFFLVCDALQIWNQIHFHCQ